MYPTTQEYNGESWRYSGVLNRVDGIKLVTYRDIKTDTKFICYQEFEGKLVEHSIADEIEEAFESNKINKYGPGT